MMQLRNFKYCACTN